MGVQPIPEGYHSITPYVHIENAEKTLEFLEAAFGARVLFRLDRADGRVWHAEVQVGDSRMMVSEATPASAARPGTFYLYVEDVDATFARAVAVGGKPTLEPTDQFYGDRHGGVQDVGGNHWWIATHVEDVPPEELERRAQAYLAEQARALEATVPS